MILARRPAPELVVATTPCAARSSGGMPRVVSVRQSTLSSAEAVGPAAVDRRLERGREARRRLSRGDAPEAACPGEVGTAAVAVAAAAEAAAATAAALAPSSTACCASSASLTCRCSALTVSSCAARGTMASAWAAHFARSALRRAATCSSRRASSSRAAAAAARTLCSSAAWRSAATRSLACAAVSSARRAAAASSAEDLAEPRAAALRVVARLAQLCQLLHRCERRLLCDARPSFRSSDPLSRHRSCRTSGLGCCRALCCGRIRSCVRAQLSLLGSLTRGRRFGARRCQSRPGGCSLGSIAAPR